jgi:hypothetical protein
MQRKKTLLYLLLFVISSALFFLIKNKNNKSATILNVPYVGCYECTKITLELVIKHNNDCKNKILIFISAEVKREFENLFDSSNNHVVYNVWSEEEMKDNLNLVYGLNLNHNGVTKKINITNVNEVLSSIDCNSF